VVEIFYGGDGGGESLLEVVEDERKMGEKKIIKKMIFWNFWCKND